MADIGFIGLGVMGRPMAGHLQAAGHRLFLFNRSTPSAAMIEAGAVACRSAAEVAERTEVVFLLLPDTPDVAAGLFGEAGLAAGLVPGKTVVDMSSISPIDTKVFAKRIESLGCDHLDAPVSGGEVGAKQATLTIMVGGQVEVFERVRPLLALMGKNVTLVGGTGDGQPARSPIKSSSHSLLRRWPRRFPLQPRRGRIRPKSGKL